MKTIRKMEIKIDSSLKHSIYKQIVDEIERGARDGSLAPGDMLPSMNVLASSHDISRETVKKAYGLLVDKGIIEPRHGKGFYVKDLSKTAKTEILVLFDKLSVYKQILFNAFAEQLGPGMEITILNHDQNPDLLEYYLDNQLDRFDYYVVAPHFSLDDETQRRVNVLLSRIPVRKLILLDKLQTGLKGNFGAVYQDFENDIKEGLEEGILAHPGMSHLRVITLPTSMYGAQIRKGIESFTRHHSIWAEFLDSVPDNIAPGDTFLILNSQLDAGLVDLARKIAQKDLVIGKDVFIISYNEFDTAELVLGGLTTVSTDFPAMGRIAANMIMSREMKKVHCPFVLTRRRTF